MTAGALPSLDLVRQVTDQHVLDQLLGAHEATRAELAAQTGISKPTISESIRRLGDAGLVTASGRQVGKRGPAGTYFRLRDDLGVAVAVAAGPAGVVVETRDLRGRLVARVEHPVAAPTDSATLGGVIRTAVGEAVGSGGPVRGCAVSLAGPVDQATGRLVRLAYAPFLLDELDPRALLAEVGCPVQVDNDVNWAALAEHQDGSAQGLDHVVHLYLGAGLGAAVLIQGRVVHGAGGLAGELAHVRTAGPGGRSLTLLQCFAAWNLLVPTTQAVDEDRIEPVLEAASASARRVRSELVEAVAGVVGSITALLNPDAVLVGGPWGTRHGFAELVAAQVGDQAAIPTAVRAGRLGAEAPLAGARIAAVRTAQRWLSAAR